LRFDKVELETIEKACSPPSIILNNAKRKQAQKRHNIKTIKTKVIETSNNRTKSAKNSITRNSMLRNKETCIRTRTLIKTIISNRTITVIINKIEGAIVRNSKKRERIN